VEALADGVAATAPDDPALEVAVVVDEEVEVDVVGVVASSSPVAPAVVEVVDETVRLLAVEVDAVPWATAR
jgi:hypothetical protein